jgi:hypothetical protein
VVARLGLEPAALAYIRGWHVRPSLERSTADRRRERLKTRRRLDAKRVARKSIRGPPVGDPRES